MKDSPAAIADPVGIYINKFDGESFKLDPNGDQSKLLEIPERSFTFQRGDINK
jgi:hypothetical protein